MRHYSTETVLEPKWSRDGIIIENADEIGIGVERICEAGPNSEILITGSMDRLAGKPRIEALAEVLPEHDVVGSNALSLDCLQLTLEVLASFITVQDRRDARRHM